MAYTSYKTRRALGKRYATDPALLLEMARLEREAALQPGRDARALQSEQFDERLAQNESQFQRKLDANEQARADAERGAMVSTVANLGMNAATIRSMTMGEGEPFFGKTVSNAGKTAINTAKDWFASDASSTAPQYVDTAAGIEAGTGLAQAPSVVTPGVEAGTGAISTSGAAAGGTAAAGPSVATPGVEAGSGAIAGGSGFNVGSAASYYGMAKLGGAALREISSEGTYGYEVGESLNRPLNVEQYWARKNDLGTDVQLALDILNPLSSVERWASDAVGTVICTELYRQGEMPGDIYLADSAYGKTLDSDVIAGYQKWAIPLASKMRDSKTITKIIKPAAISWAKHMAYLVGVREKPNLLGATLLKIGVPICRFLGEKSLEVQYG